jgi:RNA polymerase-binding transcription factor DksA
MDGIRERLEQDLMSAVGRLRQMNSAVALEEAPPITATDGFEFDEIQELERREIGFATRELLVSRVMRLQAALDRLRDGEYGLCVECGERIPPARLQALPEVQTCVICQDRIERLGSRLEAAEVEAGDLDDDD